MDELISLVKKTTAEIVSDPNDVPYQKIVYLTEIREELLRLLQGARLSEQEKKRYKDEIVDSLLVYDIQIIEIANRIKYEAAMHLKKISSGAVLKKAYDVAYDPGSLFYDKKK
jgi:hypothetical protein